MIQTHLLLLFAALFAQQPIAEGVNLYSLEKEVELGRLSASELEQALAATSDPELTRIGERLATAADSAYPYSYRLFSFDDAKKPEALPAGILAFPGDWRSGQIHEAIAVAGGGIFVGASVRALAGDEAGLAAILAHAVGHISLRHATRQASRGAIINWIQLPLTMSDSAASQQMRRQAPETFQVSMMVFARGYEMAADVYAVGLLSRAGYDPGALLRWLEKLRLFDSPAGFGLYPPVAQRIQVVKEAIDKLPPPASR